MYGETTKKNCVSHLIVILALLWWSETRPASYDCISVKGENGNLNITSIICHSLFTWQPKYPSQPLSFTYNTLITSTRERKFQSPIAMLLYSGENLSFWMSYSPFHLLIMDTESHSLATYKLKQVNLSLYTQYSRTVKKVNIAN